MRAVGVVVRDVLLQHCREVARSGDQEVVEAFAPQGADPAFHNGVRAWCSNGGADDVDVGAGEHGVEGGGVSLLSPELPGRPLLPMRAEVNRPGRLRQPGAGQFRGTDSASASTRPSTSTA